MCRMRFRTPKAQAKSMCSLHPWKIQDHHIHSNLVCSQKKMQKKLMNQSLSLIVFPNKSNTICRLLWYSDCTSKRAVEKIMNLKKMRFLGKMSNKIINIYHHSLFPSQITRKTTAIIIQCLYSTHQVLSKFNALIVLNKAFSKMLKQIKKVEKTQKF